MAEQMGPSAFLFSFLPLILFMLPLSIGVWWLCPKLPANRWLWTILSLIPGVNFFVMYIFVFLIAGAILDKLNSLQRTSPFD